MKILLVDDDQELCELLARYLEREGIETELVHTGPEGLEKGLAGKYDAIVLDIMLPGMTGLEVLAELRTKSTIPVVMLTAKGDEMDRILGLEIGADDYLPKPCNPRELLARLRAVFRRANATVADDFIDDSIIRIDELEIDIANIKYLKIKKRLN